MILLLLLQPLCLLVAFILLTEPCLNPNYVNSLRSKFGYLTLLTRPGLIPELEWRARFEKAGWTSLFGIGIIQAWFTARLNGYIQRAEREHGRIVAILKGQREKGVMHVGVPSTMMEEEQDEGRDHAGSSVIGQGSEKTLKGETEGKEEEGKVMEVGSFVRQMESVSMTFLGLPILWLFFYLLCILFGSPILTHKTATSILAAHLTLLIGLPLIHILGLPFPSEPQQDQQSSASSSTTTTVTKTATHWKSLLTLKPNPTFLLPVYYPPIFTFVGTILASAVLALDWNVAYQTYPFPNLVGALLGLVLGDFYTIFVLLFG